MLPVRSTVSTLPRIYMDDHAFNPATTAGVCTGDCTPLTGFFAGGSTASLAAALRTRRVGVIRCASGDFRNS